MANGKGHKDHEKWNRRPVKGAFGIERTQLAGAVDDVGETPTRLKADPETGSLRVNLWAWDTQHLQWVRQPLIDLEPLTKAIERM
jgi:hypothetical protein